jgi:outer membrane usher protein
MAPSKPVRKSVLRINVIAAVLLLTASAAHANLALQLEVSINGEAQNLIAGFTQWPDGSFTAKASELSALGIKLDKDAKPSDEISLASLPDTTVNYNAANQTMVFTMGDTARLTKYFDAAQESNNIVLSTGFGMVLNYTAFASASRVKSAQQSTFDGASLSLEDRVYGKLGVVSNSGIIGRTTDNKTNYLHLDSAWTYSNQDKLLTGTIGDIITGGLSWTRPVRLGGIQLRRNFGLRPDLITNPLPTINGSAAVPSTLDVYINNLKTYSQDVPAGPWAIHNVPTTNGAGKARIIVRDATGRETETTTPFFASEDLLSRGLVDFSTELGVVRKNYASQSFDYDSELAATASFRYGVAGGLTAQAHAEGNARLVNGGLGIVANIGNFGLLTLAGSASTFEARQGTQLQASFETEIHGINFNASTTRSFGDYSDLAYSSSLSPNMIASELLAIEPMKALDRASLGFRVPHDEGSIGLSLLHLEKHDGEQSWIGSLNYARSFIGTSSLSLSGFTDISDQKSYGAFLYLSVPLGNWGSGSAGTSYDRTGTSFTAEISKPQNQKPGSFGWRAQMQQGATSSQRGNLNYRGNFADLDANLTNTENTIQTSASADGAVVLAQGGIFASRRIDDAFAIVDAGAPQVRVFHENHLVGRSNAHGKILVPGLKAYEKNKIAIEPDDLPLNADVPQFETQISPNDRNGVAVSFGVKANIASALVKIVNANNKTFAPGTEGQLQNGEKFYIGYDGQAYLKGLTAHNTITITTKAGLCYASFDYRPTSQTQTYLDGIICQ